MPAALASSVASMFCAAAVLTTAAARHASRKAKRPPKRDDAVISTRCRWAATSGRVTDGNHGRRGAEVVGHGRGGRRIGGPPRAIDNEGILVCSTRQRYGHGPYAPRAGRTQRRRVALPVVEIANQRHARCRWSEQYESHDA